MFDNSVKQHWLHESGVSSLTPSNYWIMSLSSLYFTSKHLISPYLGCLKFNSGEWIPKSALQCVMVSPFLDALTFQCTIIFCRLYCHKLYTQATTARSIKGSSTREKWTTRKKMIVNQRTKYPSNTQAGIGSSCQYDTYLLHGYDIVSWTLCNVVTECKCGQFLSLWSCWSL